jgi:hypothetical protein
MKTSVKKKKRSAAPPKFEPVHSDINPLNAELNPIYHLLALLGAHHILHVSMMGVKQNCRSLHRTMGWSAGYICRTQKSEASFGGAKVKPRK